MTWSRPILYGFGFWVLVLIAAQVAKSQDTTKPIYWKVRAWTNSGMWTQGAPSFVALWDEWADSCYADSTWSVTTEGYNQLSGQWIELSRDSVIMHRTPTISKSSSSSYEGGRGETVGRYA